MREDLGLLEQEVKSLASIMFQFGLKIFAFSSRRRCIGRCILIKANTKTLQSLVSLYMLQNTQIIKTMKSREQVTQDLVITV